LSSLFSNYFVHFAGPWHESQLWKNIDLFKGGFEIAMFNDFFEYLKMPVTGKPKGSIKPKDNA